MLLNAEHEMSTFDSQSQSIPIASVRDQEIMIDRLLELRSKMQHKRRSRLQDSLLSNTLVSLTLELKCLVSSHPHLTLFLCFDGNYILKFQISLLLMIKNYQSCRTYRGLGTLPIRSAVLFACQLMREMMPSYGLTIVLICFIVTAWCLGY
jgi:hypothetical protein